MNDLRSAIVAAAAPQAPRLPLRWIDRLPNDVRDELIAIKREWRAGTIQASGRSLAAAIVANCQQRGITICGVPGVREWLASTD